MMPTKIVKKGKSKKAVLTVGGELERRRDWKEHVGEDIHPSFRGAEYSHK